MRKRRNESKKRGIKIDRLRKVIEKVTNFCPACNGTGGHPHNPCKTCGGTGQVQVKPLR